jgi:hypothetical protein
LVAERSSADIAHALRDGFARAAAAPAIVIGMFVVSRVLDVPAASLTSFSGGRLRSEAIRVLFWSFAYGGVLDRFARNRPTRAHGFFAACGAHVLPLIRIALIVALLEASVLALLPPAGASSPLFNTLEALALMIAGAVIAFARIRLVVEDRRSAAGAILAGLRFVRRNPSGILLFVLFGMVAYGVNDLFAAAAPPGALWREALLAIRLWLKLVAYASGIALFQSRLAHASYTAAPIVQWPESASAEAITNATPGIAATAPGARR